MIIARIESLILEKGIDDAIERANTYIDSGVDGVTKGRGMNPDVARKEEEEKKKKKK